MVIINVVGVSPVVDMVVMGIGDGNDRSSVLQVEVVGMISGQSWFI